MKAWNLLQRYANGASHFRDPVRLGLYQHYWDKLSRANPLHRQATNALQRNDAEALLLAVSAMEGKWVLASREVGEWLLQALSSTPDDLLEAARSAQARRPGSVFLAYVLSLCLARTGAISEASRTVDGLLAAEIMELGRGGGGKQRATRIRKFSSIWSMVDSIARDDMRWATEVDGQSAEAYRSLECLRAFRNISTHQDHIDHNIILAVAEPLLQGKHHAEYLAYCDQAFAMAQTLPQRLQVVRAMWRQGLRRIPDYTPAYDLARSSFRSLYGEIEGQLQASTLGSSVDDIHTIRILRSAYTAASHLNCHDEQQELRDGLLHVIGNARQCGPYWIAMNALSNEFEPDRQEAPAPPRLAPRSHTDLHNCFQWASRRQEYDFAKDVYSRLNGFMKDQRLALPYVNVLQRTGEFANAVELLSAIQTNMLRNPTHVDPQVSFKLFRQLGEMKFARQTARYILSSPQPTQPHGVIFVTARNIEQLRRTPIVVLMEYKKMGWAVIPVFEGILPIQKTGIEAIDRYAACIGLNSRFRSDAGLEIADSDRTQKDLAAGSLSWRGIDLSHALWEEAAISRRNYTPVWACPALQRSLGNLARWSECLGVAIGDARKTLNDLGLKVGIHIFFTYRLPDAVSYHYCQAHGDPEAFFSVHACNSYENYFCQFSYNISTRFSMRNLTAYAPMRAASLPRPDMVREKALVLKQNGVTERLLAAEASEVDRPAADCGAPVSDVAERLTVWKAKGGKIASLFGRVVCDSGVPYDGGPCFTSMREWLNESIDAVKGSRTLLVIRPHPHEKREEIACFLNEFFVDLIERPENENVVIAGQEEIDFGALLRMADLALVYNGTTAVETALARVPTITASYFSNVDYPVGHYVPQTKEEHRAIVRFEKEAPVDRDAHYLARAWLDLTASDEVSVPYRYHSRQITNRVVYPPFWFAEDIERYLKEGDPPVRQLAERGIGV